MKTSELKFIVTKDKKNGTVDVVLNNITSPLMSSNSDFIGVIDIVERGKPVTVKNA